MARRKGVIVRGVQLPNVNLSGIVSEGMPLTADLILKRLIAEHTAPLRAQIEAQTNAIRRLVRAIASISSICAESEGQSDIKSSEIIVLADNQPMPAAEQPGDHIPDLEPPPTAAELAGEDQYGEGRWI